MTFKHLSRMALLTSLCSIASFTLLSAASAEEIYKTIGKDGVVFYSSVPPKASDDAEVIEVPAAPSEETILAAQEELKKSLEKVVVEQEEDQMEQVNAIETQKAAKTRPPVVQFNPFMALAPFL